MLNAALAYCLRTTVYLFSGCLSSPSSLFGLSMHAQQETDMLHVMAAGCVHVRMRARVPHVLTFCLRSNRPFRRLITRKDVCRVLRILQLQLNLQSQQLCTTTVYLTVPMEGKEGQQTCACCRRRAARPIALGSAAPPCCAAYGQPVLFTVSEHGLARSL